MKLDIFCEKNHASSLGKETLKVHLTLSSFRLLLEHVSSKPVVVSSIINMQSSPPLSGVERRQTLLFTLCGSDFLKHMCWTSD